MVSGGAANCPVARALFVSRRADGVREDVSLRLTTAWFSDHTKMVLVAWRGSAQEDDYGGYRTHHAGTRDQ